MTSPDSDLLVGSAAGAALGKPLEPEGESRWYINMKRPFFRLLFAALLAGWPLLAADAARADLLFVVEGNTNTVSQIGPNGTQSTFANSGLNTPYGLAFDSSGNLYVSNQGNQTIRKFSSTGTDLGNFATTGLNGPAGVAFDSLGNLYVANLNNNTIRRFSSTGMDLGNFIATGLNGPESVRFDSSGNLYVPNVNNNTIRKFSPTGMDLGNFATTGLSLPVEVVFDSSGNLYAANDGDNTVHKFSATGGDLGTFASAGLNSPDGLAFDSLGNLYVSNAGNNDIHKFSSTGADLGVFASGGQLNTPRQIAVANPEPSSLALLGVAAASFAGYGWRCRKRGEKRCHATGKGATRRDQHGPMSVLLASGRLASWWPSKGAKPPLATFKVANPPWRPLKSS